MKRNTVWAILIAVCLILIGLKAVVAQSPIVGMPYMTDQPGGQAMRSFPKGIDTVYLVFEYDVGRETEIIVEIREEQSEGAVIFSDRRTYTGSGTATIEIKYPGGEPFRDGVYDTIIKFGPQRYITAGWEWIVGDVPLDVIEPQPQPARQSPAVQPSTGQSQPQDTLSGESTASGAAPTVEMPASDTGGLPSWLLVVLGVVVLILLGVIVWAVRGFMTAT